MVARIVITQDQMYVDEQRLENSTKKKTSEEIEKKFQKNALVYTC